MESTERALLDAILAAPDDDAPRLVYADWLQQRGDSRGELIAVGIELARGNIEKPRREALLERHEELQRAHALRLDDVPVGSAYVRGFPTQLTLWAAQLDHLPALLARAPFQRLELVEIEREVEIERLATMALGTLRELVLRTGSFRLSRSLYALAGWTELAKLEHLDLDIGSNYGSDYLDMTALVALLHSERLQLHTLVLEHGAIAGVEDFAAVLPPRALRELRLAQLTDDALARLLVAPSVQHLETLSMVCSQFTARGMELLAAWPGLAGLKYLHLDSCGLDDAAARVLAGPLADALAYLTLTHCDGLGDDARTALKARYGKRVDLTG